MLVQEKYVNETEGFICGDSGLYEPYTDNIGKLFKSFQKLYGKCVSKVYIDTLEGKVKSIGWVFQKLVKYDDSKEKFLQATWVTLHNSQPVTKVTYDYMEIK